MKKNKIIEEGKATSINMKLPNWIYNEFQEIPRTACPCKEHKVQDSLYPEVKRVISFIKKGDYTLTKKDFLALRVFYFLQEYMQDSFVKKIDKELSEVNDKDKKYKTGKEIQKIYVDTILDMWDSRRFPNDIDPMLEVKLKERFIYIPMLLETDGEFRLTEDYIQTETLQVPHTKPTGEKIEVPVIINEVMPISKQYAIAWFSPAQMVLQRELIDKDGRSSFKQMPNQFYQYLLSESKVREETKAYVSQGKIDYLNTLQGMELIKIHLDKSRVK